MMLTLLRTVKRLAPVILMLSLTGCFRSATPLVDAGQATFPFTTLTLKNPEGQISIVKRDGDVYRFVEDGKEDKTALSIQPLGPDLYLVQVAIPTGQSEYLFAQKQDDELIVRSDCKGLDPALLRRGGVEVDDTSETLTECKFNTLQSLVDLGKSPEVWANSTTTLKIVSIE